MFDETAKKMFIEMSRGRRPSQRELALVTKMSLVLMNYRLRRMRGRDFYGYTVYVNPVLMGYEKGCIAFPTAEAMVPNCSVRFLSNIGSAFYEVYDRDEKSLEARLDKMEAEKGNAIVKGKFGERGNLHTPQFNMRLVEELSKEPEMSEVELSRRLGVKAKTVERHLDNLLERELIRFIPIVRYKKGISLLFIAVTDDPGRFASIAGRHLYSKFETSMGTVFAAYTMNDVERDDFTSKVVEKCPNVFLISVVEFDLRNLVTNEVVSIVGEEEPSPGEGRYRG